MVIVRKGVEPNTQLARTSGIRVNKGILVDQFMRTNVDGVYAAGDVTEGRNRVTGDAEPVPNWINACEQGRIAGLNMAGGEETFEGSLAENATHLFGLDVAAIGVTKVKDANEHSEETRVVNLERKLYRKMVVRGNRLVCAILLGDIRDIGIIHTVIAHSIDISPFKSRIAKMPLNFARDILVQIADRCRARAQF
jgi:nitrite reductase (NADH) large subunit